MRERATCDCPAVDKESASKSEKLPDARTHTKRRVLTLAEGGLQRNWPWTKKVTSQAFPSMAALLAKLKMATQEGSSENRELVNLLEECKAQCANDKVHNDAESKAQRFCQKVRAAIDVVERTLALYPPRVHTEENGSESYQPRIGLSFNGGKDCTVVLHLLLAALEEQHQPSTTTQGSFEQASMDPAQMSSSCALSHSVMPFYFSSEDVFPQETAFVESTVNQFFLNDKNNSTLLKMQSRSNKEGVSYLVEEQKIEAILMGTRSSDPDGVWLNGVFWPSSKGWPSFMRVNPCLCWSYQDVWTFLRFFGIKYCSLYDVGYTSIGSKSTTQPNPQLKIQADKGGKDCPSYYPAYMLLDGDLERMGRSLPKTAEPATESH